MANELRLYIDGSKLRFNCVILHKGNEYGSILIAHSTSMKNLRRDILSNAPMDHLYKSKDIIFPPWSAKTQPFLAFRDRIILISLHINLGLVKQLVLTLNKNSLFFEYIPNKFPGLRIKKIKAGIFDDPRIKQRIND
ncbi:hypothetical protein PR048_015671 [Dryococelus australis]|uniref:Uncharacterized protein n=1 Tax=Dryococelus australis TaxID=614101 RepID=A0ABQ9HHK7_9NEOP|nr:hypothetical protein PR048_015671 [Dryococelus australis]